MQRIYFTRHGYAETKEPWAVTPHGLKELEQTRSRLRAAGFCATSGVSSTELRATQTSQFLSYGTEPVCLEILHAYNGFEGVPVVMRGGRGGSWKNSRVYADRALQAILRVVPKEGCVVVSGHDHIPLMLALRYAQINGAEIVWDYLPDPHQWFPDQGEGVLVEGKSMRYFFRNE